MSAASWQDGRWLVVDTETTGLDDPQDPAAIVELGAVIMECAMSRADWYVAWRARRAEDSVDRRAHAREIEACYRGQYAHDRLGWRARHGVATGGRRGRGLHRSWRVARDAGRDRHCDGIDTAMAHGVPDRAVAGRAVVKAVG